MRGRTGGRVRLLELILDLCVFAVCAVVCVLLLVRAQGISAGSQRLTRAVYLAQSAAETWKAAGGTPGAGALAGEGYAVEIEEGAGEADVTVTWNGETVYTIEGVLRVG